MARSRLIVAAMLVVSLGIATGAQGWLAFLSRQTQQTMRVQNEAYRAALAAERIRAANERVDRIVLAHFANPGVVPLKALIAALAENDAAVAALPGDDEPARALRSATKQRQTLVDKRLRLQGEATTAAEVTPEIQRLHTILEAIIGEIANDRAARLPALQQTAEMLSERHNRHGFLALCGGLLVLFAIGGVLGAMSAARQAALRLAKSQTAEARLAEAKLSAMVSIAADAIITINSDQHITVFNEGAEQIFGYKKSEVLGTPLTRLIPARHRDTHHKHVQGFAAGPVTARRMGERTPIFALRKDGEEFPAEAAISRVDVGGAAMMTVVLRDVTEQKREEARQRLLAEAGEALGASLDYESTLPRVAEMAVAAVADWCAIYLADENGNPRRLRVATSDPKKEEVARAFDRFPVDERRAFIRDALVEGRSLLVPVVDPERTIATLDDPVAIELVRDMDVRSIVAVPMDVGPSRRIGAMLLMSSHPRRQYNDADLLFAQKLAHLAALAVDSSRLYQSSVTAKNARDDVLGIVAHDLRSPLNGMVLSLDVLTQKLRKRGIEDVDSWLLGLRTSAGAMNRLIQDLLDVAKMDAGTLRIDKLLCDPTRLVEEAVTQAKLLASGLRIEIHVANPLPRVQVDEGRILQVFTNLLGNAIKFTPDGGEISVNVSRIEGALLFEVADTGPGLAAEHLPHLFNRFWQVDKKDRRGAGLGLSIAKGIIEGHGGRIWAESEVGRGMRFYFMLPTDTLAPLAVAAR